MSEEVQDTLDSSCELDRAFIDSIGNFEEVKIETKKEESKDSFSTQKVEEWKDLARKMISQFPLNGAFLLPMGSNFEPKEPNLEALLKMEAKVTLD